MRVLAPLLLASALTACSMAPKYVRPELPVPQSWPVGDAYLRQSEAALPSVTYRDIFRDARLQQLIDQALANNRNLRATVENIAAARAQYRIQRAELFPQIDAGGTTTRREIGASAAGGNFAVGGTTYQATIGVSAFELDLFGRNRSLTDAALARYYGQEAAARAVRLTLTGDVAGAWLTYAADQSLLKLAEDTAAAARRSVSLTQARVSGGVAPRTDLRQAEQILATAEANIASQRTALAQDVNALQLLVGAPIDRALLPPPIEEAAKTVAELPAGLDSRILLRRPDVVQAEYELRASNAEIGAARAALFPTISLTGLFSFASTALSSLLEADSLTKTATGNIAYPIFRAGAGRAGVEQASALQRAALATYEGTIQTAFREVADALARRGTISEELAANERFATAAADTYRLSEARYRGGIDTFLTTLDAQRSLYAAQQSVLQTRLVRATNLVTLYRTLGGDSQLDVEATGAVPAPQPVGRQ
ncbi:outer membrane protein, multidrug efflux system [Sphingomonas sp. OV641]|uniref:efflux transporter outer membrane subunit n=1 Tax=Sphingomonas sp. OV641 TaxID=1881068 RepID=UPI0008D4E7F1|nr:efflux transporter outer membrane subunit [Sphingomonas sp. OV641]SEI85515.1 outer membrane protein, multidrug efflux system [Sphingomonas sp. OV641]